MNTTALRTTAALPRHTGNATTALKEAIRTTARDFIGSLLAVTKGQLLSQQSVRPRMRRF